MDNVFRIRKGRETTSKKSQEIVSGTLDSVHQGVVTTILNSAMTREQIQELIQQYSDEIDNLDKSNSLNGILKASKLREEIRELEKKFENENPLQEYYLRNADIMLKYYGNNEKSQSVSTSSSDQNTFMKYLVPTISDTSQISKKQLFEEYTSRMKLHTGAEVEEKKVVVEHCDRCNIAREEFLEEGILVCPSCGSEEHMMVVSDYPSFRDPPKERNNYAYKKINHLNEILNQFQAKESTIIPDEIMNEVVLEIKKQRIQNIAELTEKEIREILKKLNRSKYYEHATHILSRLNGNPPPTITPEIEEKIRAMFQEIQAPFLIYCPNDRTNFLSYSYILYKFFELLDLDEYKVYFPLLKSRDRLIQHDQIWKKICEYLKWEYIQSV